MTFFYENLCDDIDGDLTVTFSATIGGEMTYHVTYDDCTGGCNRQKPEMHTCKDSYLNFRDQNGSNTKLLINNSGSAHLVKNVRFSSNCPFTRNVGNCFKKNLTKAAKKTFQATFFLRKNQSRSFE